MWKAIWDNSLIPETEPYVLDCRSFDIPETIEGMIVSASKRNNCVAVTLCLLGGHKMIEIAENMAFEKGMRILWWFGPCKYDIPEVNRNELCSFAKTIRTNLILASPRRF